MSALFVMAGGGTGGHVIPAIAVARELAKAGARVRFVGTERGVEHRLVPAAGFELELVRVGGLKNLGPATRVVSLWRLARETVRIWAKFAAWKPAAVFSMGGYVAGPPVLAAILRGVPVVAMEPNAMPGATNRWVSRWIRRALVSFEETTRFFPKGRTEVTGLPVRDEFFAIPAKAPEQEFTVLITGGSQGSQTLNEAARASWPLFRAAGSPVRLIHQTGLPMHDAIANDFSKAALEGEVRAFIADMPAAFAAADVVLCRSGAGAVSELAAAGKPSVLIPFPYAADDHQLKNAQAFERAGAAIVATNAEWTGQRMFDVVEKLRGDRDRLREMGENARKMARAGAARRAAEILMAISREGAAEKH